MKITLILFFVLSAFVIAFETISAGECSCLCERRPGVCGGTPPYLMVHDCFGDGTSAATCSASNGCNGRTRRYNCSFAY